MLIHEKITSNPQLLAMFYKRFDQVRNKLKKKKEAQ